MRSILEFALFAWVGISIVAVLVQLIRIARFKRANSTSTSGSAAASAPQSETPTINLEKRLASSDPQPKPTTPPTTDVTAEAMAGAPNADTAAVNSAPPSATPNAAKTATPTTAAAATGAAAAAAAAVARPVTAKAEPSIVIPSAAPAATADPEATADPAVEEAPAAPTLADLLAGVRLPWNLLPTVDQSREPSNDRVVLITADGEPGDIGVDVADELERLGFTIAPRGDDTAVATRDGNALGLQIIEDPMAAEVDGVRRFPTATSSSVALDIWIDSATTA